MKRDLAPVFTPVSIGKAVIKNRLVFPSMCTFFSDDRGAITPRIMEFIRARAAGGVGMLIIPGTPYGTGSRGRPAISEDRCIKGWQDLKAIASGYGASLFCQLHPLAIRRDGKVLNTADYTLDDIRWLTQAYAEGALRARRAGLDGVEVHGSQISEIAEFLSPFQNHRGDDYGGDLAGRSRFALEIVRAIKSVAGSDFPVIFRFSVDEHVPGGRDLAESVQLARLLESAGADALHATAGSRSSPQWTHPPMEVPPGPHVRLASAVKRAVAIPVITVGRIIDLSQAAKIISEGQADLVAMGRALLADPDLPRKTREGRMDEIRRCFGCNQACQSNRLWITVPQNEEASCLHTPRTGREGTLVYSPVLPGQRKTILVAGAGPAGLEAACVAAERGHRVKIFEQNGEAGGTLLLAAKPPHKRAILEVIRFRLKCLQRLGVAITFNEKVGLKTVADVAPDVVIVATGSSPAYPPFAANRKAVYTVDEVLSGKLPAGRRMLLVGGGMVECEVADYLSGRGYEVALVAGSKSLAGDLPASRRRLLLERLQKRGVGFTPESGVLEVALPRVKLLVAGQEEIRGDFDALVCATRRPNNELADALKNSPLPLKVFTVGDAVAPRTALEAILEAALVAAEV